MKQATGTQENVDTNQLQSINHIDLKDVKHAKLDLKPPFKHSASSTSTDKEFDQNISNLYSVITAALNQSFQSFADQINSNTRAAASNQQALLKMYHESHLEIHKSIEEMHESICAIEASLTKMEERINSTVTSQVEKQFSREKKFIKDFATLASGICSNYLEANHEE